MTLNHYFNYGGSGGKESAYNAGNVGSIFGSGQIPGERNGYPLQYSCPKNSMNRIHGTGKQFGASQMVQMVENLPANARDTRDTGLISRLGKSPGERNGNSLQYSCLENSMDRRVWQATVHGVAKSQTRLSD